MDSNPPEQGLSYVYRAARVFCSQPCLPLVYDKELEKFPSVLKHLHICGVQGVSSPASHSRHFIGGFEVEVNIGGPACVARCWRSSSLAA